MGGINRTRSRIAIISMVMFIVFLIIGRISFNAYLMTFSILFLIIWLVLFLTTNRCPHCREHFRGMHWSKPSVGYCQKCGKLMEYDDSIE